MAFPIFDERGKKSAMRVNAWFGVRGMGVRTRLLRDSVDFHFYRLSPWGAFCSTASTKTNSSEVNNPRLHAMEKEPSKQILRFTLLSAASACDVVRKKWTLF